MLVSHICFVCFRNIQTETQYVKNKWMSASHFATIMVSRGWGSLHYMTLRYHQIKLYFYVVCFPSTSAILYVWGCWWQHGCIILRFTNNTNPYAILILITKIHLLGNLYIMNFGQHLFYVSSSQSNQNISTINTYELLQQLLQHILCLWELAVPW